MSKTYMLIAKWPSGRTHSTRGWRWETADRLAHFLWECGADDVKVMCECGECETCTDRATAEGLDN